LLLAAALIVARGAVTEAAAPRRVASMNLTADEILVEILPPGRLVAVTRFADEAGTSNVVGRVPPEVARFPRADLERLVALAPDLVVVSQYTDADVLRQIEKSGIRWHRMEGLETLAGFRESILSLGRVVGEEGAASTLVAQYDARLAALARLLEGAKRPRVLYWANPYTAGANSAIGAIIEGAGAENVGRTLGSGDRTLGGERARRSRRDPRRSGLQSADSPASTRCWASSGRSEGTRCRCRASCSWPEPSRGGVVLISRRSSIPPRGGGG
jgi:iron complex transport system substrate-binding protein